VTSGDGDVTVDVGILTRWDPAGDTPVRILGITRAGSNTTSPPKGDLRGGRLFGARCPSRINHLCEPAWWRATQMDTNWHLQGTAADMAKSTEGFVAGPHIAFFAM